MRLKYKYRYWIETDEGEHYQIFQLYTNRLTPIKLVKLYLKDKVVYILKYNRKKYEFTDYNELNNFLKEKRLPTI